VLLFTADWDVADEADRIASLHVMFASKLCDLEEVARDSSARSSLSMND
jgi:hypothetical protein